MSLTKQQVTALYIAIYNRAPDAAGLEYWTTEFEGTYADAAAGFVAHPLFAAQYQDLTNQEKVEKFYTNILGSEGDTAGIDYWVARLDAGEDINVILSEFLNVSLTGDFSEDDAAQARQDTLLNKVEVALYYVAKLGDKTNMSGDIDPASADIVNDPAFKAAAQAIAGVNNTQESVDAATAAIDNQYGDLTGEIFFLTEGADRDATQSDGFLRGTDGNDKFIADVIQNQLGQQVNTLGTGDRLDGGAGKDTLEAQVASGAFAGGGSGMAIQARTKNIENIKFEAVQFNADEKDSEVFVNAKDMTEVNYIGSERSNASLTIQDLTSKGVAGGTANMAVGMKYTGNADTRWSESDLKVLFDQDYLTRTSDTENGWSYQVLNQASWDKNNSEPVKGFPLERITFTLARENMANQKVTLNFTDEDRADLITQQDLVNALNTKLAEENLTGLKFALNGTFSDPDGRTSQSINLVNTNEEQEVVAGTVGLDEDSPAGNLYWNNARLDEIVEFNPVSVNVELEKVGRAGDGGELVIGSMNKGDDDNVWGAVNTVGENTVSGIEVFNVTVDGGKAESSSLAGMRSTNNNLREVYVESVGESDANLTIGNSNTHTPTFIHTYRNGTLIQYVTEDILTRNANALKDVRIFDASSFNGDLHLQAALTGEVTEKYLAEGDGDFVYSGGHGNDHINMAISAENLAAAGTATHGDFNLEINGGGGHDTITVGIYGLIYPQSPTPDSIIDENGNDIRAEGLPALADAYPGSPWYENQKINANLTINAAEGDDTVNLLGSGDWKVNLGAGNDVIYVANGGPKSSWIFNATTPGTYHYENGWVGAIGGGNPSYNLYKVGVLLTFDDHSGGLFELGLIVEPDMTSPYKTSQKAINEAIKKAIESDNVFSKLIEAKTGQMAQTLIIDSLVDGETELEIAFEQLPIGAGQLAVNTFNDIYGSNVTENELAQAYAQNPSLDTTLVDAAFANLGYVSGYVDETFGAHIIEGGKGDDVLVLGTSDTQTHSLVYNDFENGTDTILNFTGYGSVSAGALAKTGNQLDLSSYGAEYVDFGSYTGTTWSNAGANSDLGALASLGVGDTFLRVNEVGDGVYSIEAWVTSVAGNATTDANIEKLGTIGNLDFGGEIAFEVTSFIF